MSVAVTEPRKSILATLATQYGMEAEAFERTLRNTVAKPGRDGREITREEMAACLVIAHQYGLNPLAKELYFFPDAKRGGVVPVIGVDGWCRIVNEQPAFDGVEFDTEWDDKGRPFAVTCTMHRKDRSRPTIVTEYFTECQRDTDPWQKSPTRMLRHKALIQCARVAFGFAGLVDEDDAGMIDVTPAPRPPRPPAGPAPVASLPAGVVEKPASAVRKPAEGRSAEAYAHAPAREDAAPEPVEVIDEETGEVTEAQAVESDAAESADPLLDEARVAAMDGTRKFRFWLAKRDISEVATLQPHIAELQSVAAKAEAKP